MEYRRPPREKLDSMIEDLLKNDGAMSYLVSERGLSNETIRHFQLGYSVEKNAIAIPIFKKIEGKDELINIKYRYLQPDKAKYSSERGCETWIYNEEGLHKGMGKSVLIVEGEFDLMSAWQVGIRSIISPASGKDSYGMWIELLDNIPKVFIAYDNDDAGKTTAIKMAERIGVDKCFEVPYPVGIKDANEYFKAHTRENFNELLKLSKPYYKYQFTGIGDIINKLRNGKKECIETDFIPKVEMGSDWLVTVSGRTNSGKTTFILNVANDFTKKGKAVLVMPFERGCESVGERFMQVKFDKTSLDFQATDDSGWNDIIDKSIDTPIYFSVPKKNDVIDTIIKAKKIFNTEIVIVDHLDYLVRHVTGNRETEIANTLQDLKRIAEEHKVIIIVVAHVRKVDTAGAEVLRKPNIEDLKGSSSLYQDPECVVMISAEEDDTLEVNVLKNKGIMTSKLFRFKPSTGRLTDDPLLNFD
jgi:archaellum biogenesis ATPase FlaH